MIGIIGALTEEVELLIQNMQVRKTAVVCGLTFTAGRLEDRDVVVVKCGVGKVNAAIAATVLNVRFACDTVINTGVAGGTVPRGQTVVSTELVQHDVRDEYGRVALDGFDSPIIAADADTVTGLTEAAARCGITVHTGAVVSGDQFICNSADVRRLAETFDAKAIDMESAAVAQVCAVAGMRFCALRTITDNADESALGNFYELLHTAAVTSCKILIEYLRAL